MGKPSRVAGALRSMPSGAEGGYVVPWACKVDIALLELSWPPAIGPRSRK